MDKKALILDSSEYDLNRLIADIEEIVVCELGDISEDD